jgi:hypothetical protein
VGASALDPDMHGPMPSWDELLQKYDKDGNGLISKSEASPDFVIARRVDAGNTPGATISLRPAFVVLDSNKDGQLSKSEWASFIAYWIEPPVPRGLLAIRLGGRGTLLIQMCYGASNVPSRRSRLR